MVNVVVTANERGSSHPTPKWSGFRDRTLSFGLGPALHLGGGGVVCTHCGTPGVCDPQVVQWTQQTTTVGVLCSCCPTPLAVREQGDRRGGRRMVNGYIL